MLINEIENYAKENNVPIIQQEGKDFLINVIKENNINKILEIGSAIGYSAIIMASIKQGIKVDTIERDKERYQVAVENINKSNCKKQIRIFNADALEIPNNQFDKDYDLIFVDGAKAQSKNFIQKYEPLLKSNGIIVIDNIDFHGFVSDNRQTTNRNTRQLVRKIKDFKDWILNNKNYDAKLYHQGDGIIVARKK